MNSQELLGQIARRFDESSRDAAVLAEHLESFNEILSNLNEKISLVFDVLRRLSQEDNPLKTLSNVLSKIEEENILEAVNDSFRKIEDVYLSIEEDADRIDSYVSSIDSVSESVGRSMERYMALTSQINEFNQRILQTISMLENLGVKQASEHISGSIMSIGNDLKRSNDGIKEIIELHMDLRQTTNVLNQSNKDQVECFKKLCNMWAAESLKPSVFKTKDTSFLKRLFRL